MQRTKPPFRADEVGSLLRSDRVKDARAKLEKGAIKADELRKIEDSEIDKIVHKQASIGLKLATDGEFRRSWWHFDFLRHLDRLRDVRHRGHPVRRRDDARRGHPRQGQAGFSGQPSDARAFRILEEVLRNRRM